MIGRYVVGTHGEKPLAQQIQEAHRPGFQSDRPAVNDTLTTREGH